ncbi:MAG: SAM-dependent methyltransferase [Clostridiales bacterium]|nr:SAM-dependent methyltransferase [Clostridiales bacterium]
MDGRLEILFDLVGSGKLFADIGCDHGKISKAVLDSGKFERVIISDISAQSLKKAQKLLESYGDKVTAIVSDGFDNYLEIPDEAMIAGMGGEEIVKILLNANSLPNSLVLAPQKNNDKVRRTLVLLGYKILTDFTFYERGKFYDVIRAEKGKDFYTEDEYSYGRDNLKYMPDGFIKKLNFEKNLYLKIIGDVNASQSAKCVAEEKLKKIKEFINED